jgi:hypothetical protein
MKLRHKSPASRVRFEAAFSKYRSATRKLAVGEEHNVLATRNGLFRHYKARTQGYSREIPKLCTNGLPIENPREIADAFAAHFSGVYSKDDGADCESALPPPLTSRFLRVRMTPTLVSRVLSHLAPKLSRGPDGIPPLFLKELHSELATPLSLLFTRSLENADVPAQFYPCVTTPVFKGGGKDSTSPKNYRPINVCSSICKAFELCLNYGLTRYLDFYSIIPSSQHGYRPKHSVTGQLAIAATDFAQAIASGKTIYEVLLDFKSAFDSPPTRKIIAKLVNIGIAAPALNWIADFIAHRSARVKVGDCLSDPYTLDSGLAQGSPLSATLWTIFMRDVQLAIQELDVSALYYADDSKIYSSDPTALQAALDLVEVWCSRNQVSLSVSKCVMSIYGAVPPTPPALTLSGIPLSVADGPVRDLGVLFDTRLSFSSHVQSIIRRANGVSNLIFRVFSSRDPLIYSRAFSVYVQPILEFSSQVWNGISKRDANRIESVLRSFSARVLRRCGIRSKGYEDRLVFLKLSKLSTRRALADVRFAHSFVHRKHSCSALALEPQNTRYSIRDDLRLSVATKPPRTLARAPSHRISSRWNSLPLATRKLEGDAFSERALASLSDL